MRRARPARGWERGCRGRWSRSRAPARAWPRRLRSRRRARRGARRRARRPRAGRGTGSAARERAGPGRRRGRSRHRGRAPPPPPARARGRGRRGGRARARRPGERAPDPAVAPANLAETCWRARSPAGGCRPSPRLPAAAPPRPSGRLADAIRDGGPRTIGTPPAGRTRTGIRPPRPPPHGRGQHRGEPVAGVDVRLGRLPGGPRVAPVSRVPVLDRGPRRLEGAKREQSRPRGEVAGEARVLGGHGPEGVDPGPERAPTSGDRRRDGTAATRGPAPAPRTPARPCSGRRSGARREPRCRVDTRAPRPPGDRDRRR